ncbi:hypothetical protein ACH5RR_025929 [Cinchona calisaya]|uniref:Uncharacterized protein n=1 Tax=Cinchona calisaya TaxID=153742 RepID=A0ABD2Z531_9GENT
MEGFETIEDEDILGVKKVPTSKVSTEANKRTMEDLEGEVATLGFDNTTSHPNVEGEPPEREEMDMEQEPGAMDENYPEIDIEEKWNELAYGDEKLLHKRFSDEGELDEYLDFNPKFEFKKSQLS